MKKNMLIIFILLALVQLYVPFKMIFDREMVLHKGKEFRFKTAPIDPYDPFRGKYIDLSFDANEFSMEKTFDCEYGEEVFVILKIDSLGYAQIQNISLVEPDENVDYVEAKVRSAYLNDDSLRDVFVEYPFDRFYMDEFNAGDAELAYRESQVDTGQTAYAIVYVKSGKTALKDVILNNRPIKEVAEEMLNEKKV